MSAAPSRSTCPPVALALSLGSPSAALCTPTPSWQPYSPSSTLCLSSGHDPCHVPPCASPPFKHAHGMPLSTTLRLCKGHAGLAFSLRPVWLLLEGIWLLLEGKGYAGCSRRHLQLCIFNTFVVCLPYVKLFSQRYDASTWSDMPTRLLMRGNEFSLCSYSRPGHWHCSGKH